MKKSRALSASCVLVLALAASSCSSGGGDDGGGDQTLTVLAAASLTESFTTLAEEFEADNEGVDVRPAFDSSATLASQVLEGAPADVLATADTTTMDTVVAEDGTEGEAEVFATNTMVMVVPADNPAGITTFADVNQPDTVLVTCVQTAPCGDVGQQLLELNEATTAPSSEEVDVKAVLAKVTSGEADAGLVYASDAVAAGDDVMVVEVPQSETLVNDYAIAVVSQSENTDLAGAFLEFVQSARGQEVLGEAGFGSP